MFGTADFTGIMLFFLGFIDKSSSTNEIKWMKPVWSNIVKCISILQIGHSLRSYSRLKKFSS